jgi:hypothetical protein
VRRIRLHSLRDERGIALATVVLVGSVLTLVSLGLITTVTDEGARSAAGVRRSMALQAAEAGMREYVAKLTEDKRYYSNRVTLGESTRRATSGTTVDENQPWGLGATWTYANGKDNWRTLSNGYQYNIQIEPPAPGSDTVKITATGRGGNPVERKAVEAIVRPTSLADFQMVSNSDISYGASAITRGKIYAGKEADGTTHDVRHDGTAYADIYAEGSITGATTLRNGAQKYDGTTIRSVVPNEIQFDTFTVSLVEIQTADQSDGLFLTGAAPQGWRLTFNAGGTIRVERCSRRSGDAFGETQPRNPQECSDVGTYAVPANGAIYSTQPVMVSGQVNGRVTIASNQEIVVGNNISYVTPGDDVLGLIARTDIIVAEWAPTSLSWRAATIAQTGQWRSWSSSGSHNGTMTFLGSTATNQGGFMDMFASRVYDFDTTLYTLPPPWFPVVENAFSVVMYREVRP